MARHFEPPATDETRGPKVLTLVLVTFGALLVMATAFYVRPAPKVEDRTVLTAPVVPAALLATQTPVKPIPQPEVAKAPSLPADKERLALAMALAEKTRSLAPAPQASPILAPDPMVPPSRSMKSGLATTQTASTAPVLPAAMLADRGQGVTEGQPARSLEDQRKDMAEQAAKAIIEGDIPGARQFLERSIASGDKQSLLALGETYDPVMLSAMKIKDIRGDVLKARELYEKARKSGIRLAGKRLAALKKYEHSN